MVGANRAGAGASRACRSSSRRRTRSRRSAALARFHRRRFAIPVVGITGSNGKTTTKEMIAAILATRGPVLKTEGNLNNEVGVPLTLLRLGPEHTAAVVEMGMNHPGEIARLTAIAEPHVGVITNAFPGPPRGAGHASRASPTPRASCTAGCPPTASRWPTPTTRRCCAAGPQVGGEAC